MTTNSRNYTKLKAVLQAVSPGEDNPFPLWQQWSGSFSFENNYPIRNGVELTLINRSSKHCICGHWTGKRDKEAVAPLSVTDSTPDAILDSIHEEEMTIVNAEKLRLERNY